MNSVDLRLHGGQVLLASGTLEEVDVLVGGGRIVGLCDPSLAVAAAETVDCRGLVVMPGAIDAHVHLGRDITVPTTPEEIVPEGKAAAAGGVTAFLAYLMTPTPYDQVVGPARELMEAHCAVDFGFHFCVVTDEQLARVPAYGEDLGVSSFKFFMNFRGDEGRYLGLPGNDDGFLFDLLGAAAGAGAMVDPHAENIEVVWRLRARAPEGEPLEVWNAIRPAFVEAEAEQRAAYLASVTGASMYAVHVSSQAALEALVAQRARHPAVFLETCPHYLTHDVDCGLGCVGKVNPPLRSAADREALWAALADGTIDVVGSDHVPRPKTAKAGDIWKASAGFPGLQSLLPILLSEGHHRRGIPLGRIAQLVSSRPAQLFGLWPSKGAVAPGADADFAIVDLAGHTEVTAEGQHSEAGYSIYEGWKLQGRIVHTIVRGRFAQRDGAPLDGPGGRYLARSHSGTAALAAAGFAPGSPR